MEKAKKRNPAPDPRKMRRVIAEDPSWNLELVPPLVDVCISHIVEHFASNPLLDQLLPKHRTKVLEQLSASVPLRVTAPLICEKSYWERCCRGRWPLCDVSKYSNDWKKMYFERNASEMVEGFVPGVGDLSQLEETLGLSSQLVHRLRVGQLLPTPPDLSTPEQDDGASDDGVSVCSDHLDCGVVLKQLRHLEELSLTFGVSNCGMNFEWSLFEFTTQDCQSLAKGLKATPTLKVFRLTRSKVGDRKGRVIIAALLDHPSLTLLDLSHNKLGDSAGRALGKLLNGHSPALSSLALTHNELGVQAGLSIGHSLATNTSLTELDLRMNRLTDEGVQPLLKALCRNSSLRALNIGSNDIGEASAPALSEVLLINKSLDTLNITCNKFGEAGGKLLQEGIEDNVSLMTFDLRLTELSQESEYCINQVVKNNQDRAAGLLVT